MHADFINGDGMQSDGAVIACTKGVLSEMPWRYRAVSWENIILPDRMLMARSSSSSSSGRVYCPLAILISMLFLQRFESVVLDRDSVIVKGASHQLEKVAIVKAIIDVDNISNVSVGSTTLNDVSLIPYDSEGNKLDVEIVPSKVNATLKITSPSKEVPIKLIASGELDGVAIKSLTTSTTMVTVYGTEEAVNNLEYLPVTVDVSGVKEDKTYSINLTKPNGIREISVKTINVELKVDNIISKDIEGIPIDPINVGEGYKVQAIGEENRTVTVIVKGSQDVIDSLDSSMIEAYIDLSGLSIGEHSVEVQVKGEDSRLTYTPRIKEIKVKISQK